MNIPKAGWIFFCVASFILGVFLAHPYHNRAPAARGTEQASADHWITLTLPSNTGDEAVTYSDEASKSEVKLPPLKSLTGKARFVKGISSNPSDTKLGYIIDADITPFALPPQSEPKDMPWLNNKADIKTGVSYEVIFYFILKDKDGFPLMKLVSNKEAVRSGMDNHFQFFATNLVPAPVVANTGQISVRMEALKCLSCASEEGNSSSHQSAKHKRYFLF